MADTYRELERRRHKAVHFNGQLKAVGRESRWPGGWCIYDDPDYPCDSLTDEQFAERLP